MKAVVVRAFGPYHQAEYAEVDDPAAGPGEVVVQLEASDVNFPDLLYIEGKYQSKPPLPFSPGLGGAGRIVTLGAGVTALSIGQKVAVLPRCGTYAEKICAPACHCFPMPESMPFEVAAALGLVYQTAYFALITRGGFKPGDVVLVLGATGGIGMATVQLAKALGAGTVIAATRGAKSADLARQLGADVTVDATMDNVHDGLREAVRQVTDNELGADIVVDPVGGNLSMAALRALRWSGRHVVVGFVSGEIPKFSASYLLVKNISVCGLQWTDYREHQLDDVHAAQRRIFRLWARGRLHPLISATVPLDRYALALADIRSGRANGKIVLLTQQCSREESPSRVDIPLHTQKAR